MTFYGTDRLNKQGSSVYIVRWEYEKFVWWRCVAILLYKEYMELEVPKMIAIG